MSCSRRRKESNEYLTWTQGARADEDPVFGQAMWYMKTFDRVQGVRGHPQLGDPNRPSL